MTDTPKEWIFDGGPAWRPEKALDALDALGVEARVPAFLTSLQATCAPADPLWFGQRLGALFVLFNPTRAVEPDAFRLWNDEATRLLSDLPHDIVAHAIDEAIRRCPHGFMPSVGEIRRIADPLVTERAEQIDRLGKMEVALLDPVATEQRMHRRRDQEAHLRAMAGLANQEGK
ncbi:hypothetical protein [Novosphingobium sp. 9]|uniref:hypothetical protein n=1 Tax=Novosphingobium sp. 9 TaxID=2025349 RepID=UPI0021B6B20E|nr:hypothetical protein [Novosphingobium sp. 9]